MTQELNLSVKPKEESKPTISKSRLAYLSLFKFLAMILIIYTHVMPEFESRIPVAARMVEFLFVSGGFCMAYNYIDRNVEPNLKSSFKYIYKKMLVIWPLHILMLVGYILFKRELYPELDAQFFSTVFTNGLLLQAWSPYERVYFSFNSPTWFLSSLLFCYLLTPFMLQCLKSKKKALIIFVGVFLARFLLEVIYDQDIDPFMINFHVNPVTRCMEFFMGMLVVPSFLYIKEKLSKNNCKSWFKLVMTGVEIALPFIAFLLMYFLSGKVNRAVFSLIFVALTFTCSLGFGYLEKAFSFKWVQKIFSYQLEMYVMQIVMNYTINLIFANLNWYFPENLFGWFMIKLAFIFVCAVVYKEFISRWIAKGLDKLCMLIKNKLIVPIWSKD